MRVQVEQGSCLSALTAFPDGSAQMCITSPPYWGLRDYGTATWEGGNPECEHSCGSQVNHTKDAETSRAGLHTIGVRPGADTSTCRKCGAVRIDDQLGLEATPDEYVSNMVQVFREVRRILADDGTLWLNVGDSYAGFNNGHSVYDSGESLSAGMGQRTMSQRRTFGAGLKNKDLVGIPWMLAFALRADGWYLRQDIIWAKPCPMPESVRDRCTKSHEYLFLLSKKPTYYYNADAIKEKAVSEAGNRNKRSVWSISARPFNEAHFATMPVELAANCVLAGSRPSDTVLDPFMGAYTTAYAALQLGRNAIGTELNPEYVKIGERRIKPLLAQPALLGAE